MKYSSAAQILDSKLFACMHYLYGVVGQIAGWFDPWRRLYRENFETYVNIIQYII